MKKLVQYAKQFVSKGRIDDEEKESEARQDQVSYQTYFDTARKEGERHALLINGEMTDVKYSYANCCNPIPGDDVIGFISRTGDVKIHRSNCKNTRHLIKTDSERIIDVSWAKNIDSKFLGAIKIIGEDRVGLINDLTDVVSKSMKTNMKSINVNSESGMFEGVMTVFIEDLDHLDRIIKQVRKVEGVKTARRYE